MRGCAEALTTTTVNNAKSESTFCIKGIFNEHRQSDLLTKVESHQRFFHNTREREESKVKFVRH